MTPRLPLTLAAALALPIFLGAADCQDPPDPELDVRATIDRIYANLQPEVPPDPVHASLTLSYANIGQAPITLDPVFSAELVSADGSFSAHMPIDQVTDEVVILEPGQGLSVPYQKGRLTDQRGSYPCGEPVIAQILVTGEGGSAAFELAVETAPATFGCVY